MNAPQLHARPLAASQGGRGELALRYVAATAVTLIALAAAQLVVATPFVLWLVGITLVGVPFSLWVRAGNGRIGGLNVPRPLWNAATVVASGVASHYFLRGPLSVVWNAATSGNSNAFLQMGQTEPMILLVQLFLVFAAFRSWTLLSDKDATLATVPSFSVLLLLIPVHRSVEVVFYFLAWTVAAATLFALEHRAEVRALVVASVPAPAPGQDVKLAARSLAGVLGISLVAAVALSGFLTARDPADGAARESAVAQMASRWTQWGMQMMGGTGASGPERQIDFSSPTSVPTLAVLWQGIAVTSQNKPFQPPYWRLFTLSNYDGATWTQTNENTVTIARARLTPKQFPIGEIIAPQAPKNENRPSFRVRRRDNDGANTATNSSPGASAAATAKGATPKGATAGANSAGAGASGTGNSGTGASNSGDESARGERRRRTPLGFGLASTFPGLVGDFGAPQTLVGYQMRAQRPNLGFVPLLSSPLSIVVRGTDQTSVRARSDGSVDVNVTGLGQGFIALSRVAQTPDNGFGGDGPPRRRVAPRPGAPRLSAAERAANLKLPATLAPRVKQLALATVKGAPSDASSYARALLLARETQRDSIYTLRPPPIPAGREAADFFLFESRRGFCTYYAGALAVLCRSAGIPARVVSGFAAPDSNDTGEIVLRDANAHAWTEIWVENWGWATVDATPAADRGDNAPTFLENWSDLFASKFDAAWRFARVHLVQLLVGGALLALALLLWRARRWLRRRFKNTPALEAELQRREIAQSYRAATRELSRRFRPRAAWETPDEWLLAAREALPLLPFEPLQKLTALYVRAHFSPRALEVGAARQARAARENVRWPRSLGRRKA